MSKAAKNQSIGTTALFTVCADPELGSLVSQAPGGVAGLAFAGEFQEYITPSRRPQYSQGMKAAPAWIALIDFDKDPDAAIQTAEILNLSALIRVTCIGIASQLDTDLLLRAMRAGCSEFLQKPVAAARLQQTLERLQTRLASMTVAASTGGKVLSLFGAKGGVGTSTLAVHLAAYLVKQHGKKTLLIDYHHQLGHSCLYLGIKDSQYHFDELVRNVDRLDADLLRGFLMTHGSGLSVIASPDVCSVPYRVTHQEMERVFKVLRHEYDFIIIDSSLQEEQAPATIQLSDEVYLVATPDVAALRNASRQIEDLNLSESVTSRLRIVINRASSRDAISAAHIEKALRLPVFITIPNHYAELLHAINSGEFIAPQKRSEFTAQLGTWATQLVNHGGEAEEKHAAQKPRKTLAFWK